MASFTTVLFALTFFACLASAQVSTDWFSKNCPEGCRAIDMTTSCGSPQNCVYCNMTVAGDVTLGCNDGNIYHLGVDGCTSWWNSSYPRPLSFPLDVGNTALDMASFLFAPGSEPFTVRWYAVGAAETLLGVWTAFVALRFPRATSALFSFVGAYLFAAIVISAIHHRDVLDPDEHLSVTHWMLRASIILFGLLGCLFALLSRRIGTTLAGFAGGLIFAFTFLFCLFAGVPLVAAKTGVTIFPPWSVYVIAIVGIVCANFGLIWGRRMLILTCALVSGLTWAQTTLFVLLRSDFINPSTCKSMTDVPFSIFEKEDARCAFWQHTIAAVFGLFFIVSLVVQCCHRRSLRKEPVVFNAWGERIDPRSPMGRRLRAREIEEPDQQHQWGNQNGSMDTRDGEQERLVPNQNAPETGYGTAGQ